MNDNYFLSRRSCRNFKPEKVDENTLKEKADYGAYKDNTPEPMPKFKFRKEMIEEFKNELMERISPFLE